MSLPRILTLRPNGSLGVEPVPELRRLRGDLRRVEAIEIASESSIMLEGAAGDCVEILAEFAAGDAAVGVMVRRSPDGAEETVVRYDRETGYLIVDCERSSLDVKVDREVQGTALPLPADEPLQLHIFVDRSVIEVFANGRVCVSDRVYPARSDSVGVGVFARGGDARLTSWRCWQVKPIWPSEA